MADLLSRLTTALAGRYTVERELGAGGMATVFLAEDLKHRRPVAIKVLKSELAAICQPRRRGQRLRSVRSIVRATIGDTRVQHAESVHRRCP